MRSKNKRNFDLILVPKWEALRCQKGNISLYLLQNEISAFPTFYEKRVPKGTPKRPQIQDVGALGSDFLDLGRFWEGSDFQ